MSKLNYVCENNVSDDDCNKCLIYGIIFSCLPDCPDFKDSRAWKRPGLTKEEIEHYSKLAEHYNQKAVRDDNT